MVKAASGIIVSTLVLTDGADEAVPLPVFANELVAALRAELLAMLAADTVLDDAADAVELALLLPLALVLDLELDVVPAVTVPITLIAIIVGGISILRRRIRDEETEMLAKHGDEYAVYLHETDAVIPNVW